MRSDLFSTILLIAVISFLINGCGSKDQPLPAQTTEGLNTFGCKINGKTWIATGRSNENGPGAKAIEVEFKQLNPNEFYLFIHTNANTSDRVQLTLSKATVGINTLRNFNDAPFGIFYDNQFRIFNSMESNPGKVEITRLDTLNKIISGTFEFDAQYIVSKEIVHIAEGRFDIDMDDLDK